MNPYDWLFANGDLAFWYAGFALILLAWAWFSLRAMWAWAVSLRERKGKWSTIPDWKASKEIALFVFFFGVNLIVMGGFVRLIFGP